MKTIPIAAAALLFGTSAYAMMPSTPPTGVMMQEDSYAVTPTAAPYMTGDEAPAFQPATETWWTDKNAADDGFKTAAASDDMKMADMAATDAKADVADSADLQPASLETGFAADETVADSGMSNAYETADTTASMAPQPAAQNYPACRPGRGDDHCIQLYEPGVRAELASWSQPTGGFAGSADTQVAMGGPYEPVDSATETERLNQQALAESNSAVRMASADDQALDDSAIQTAEAEQGNMTAGEEPTAEDMADI